MQERWTHNMGLVLPDGVEELVARFSALSWHDWGWSLGIVALAALLGAVAGRVGVRALQRWSRRTTTIVDDVLVEHLGRPIRTVLPFVLVWLCMPAVALPAEILGALRHAVLLASIGGVGWVVLAALASLEEVINAHYDINVANNLDARATRTRIRAFRNIGAFVIVVLTIGFALMTFDAVRQLGTGLLASAGLAGVVLGFAAQRSIATMVAGIQIALAQPIRVDDVVIVEGQWGRIEEITLTYVVVRIWDLRRLIVPITYFLEKPFENWTRVSAELLGTVELQLDYSVPVDAVRAELARICEASEHWDGQTQGVAVVTAGERTMTVRPLVSAADAGALWNLRCEVREKLIDFINREYPGCLPRLRVAEPKAAVERVS